jgi:putative SOS response-associated peptidase YedK
MAPIHNRMPVILQPGDESKWLDVGHVYIPMKSAPIPKQSGKHAEQIGSPGSRSEATLGFCS